MKARQYDILIIGGGPAGYYCALHCSKAGQKVALVEKEDLGGTGLRWGCLPVKRILDDYKTFYQLKKLQTIVLSEEVLERTAKSYREEMMKIEEKISRNLQMNKVDLYFGEGAFLDNYTYAVEENVLKARYIVIATGTSPKGLDGFNINGRSIITHKEAVNLNELPKSIMIIGGNVEGCEFAALFAELGVKVVLIEKEETILQGNDKDIITSLERSLEKQGVELHKGVGARGIKECQEKKITVVLENNSEIRVEKVLVTGSRKPNFPIGMEKIGLQVEKDKIIVDKDLKTSVSNIYAIGDINGILGMAHAAIQQGIAVAENILLNSKVDMAYKALPRAVFTIPEIAGVGYQENELLVEEIPYKKGICKFSDTWRGFSKNTKDGFVKVLVGKDDKLLGVWMVGDDVSEYIGLMGVLIHKGVTTKEIKNNLIIHPSLNEAMLEALLNLE